MPDSLPPEAPPARPHRGGTRRGRASPASPRARGRRRASAISFGDMVDAFDARAYGPLIVLFAAPNVLPVALPGISAVLGVPLILLTAQLDARPARGPWLPGSLRAPVAGAATTSSRSSTGSRRGCTASRADPAAPAAADRPVGKRLIGAAGLMLAPSSSCRCPSATPSRASRWC